jgi:hypothetical protein
MYAGGWNRIDRKERRRIRSRMIISRMMSGVEKEGAEWGK